MCSYWMVIGVGEISASVKDICHPLTVSCVYGASMALDQMARRASSFDLPSLSACNGLKSPELASACISAFGFSKKNVVLKGGLPPSTIPKMCKLFCATIRRSRDPDIVKASSHCEKLLPCLNADSDVWDALIYNDPTNTSFFRNFNAWPLDLLDT